MRPVQDLHQQLDVSYILPLYPNPNLPIVCMGKNCKGNAHERKHIVHKGVPLYKTNGGSD